jgi:signal transduction histidine kinase
VFGDFTSLLRRSIARHGDIALALAATAILLAEYSGASQLSSSEKLVAGALAAGAGVGVALRRRGPLLFLAAVELVTALYAVLPQAENGIAWAVVAMIAIYTVASESQTWTLRLGAVLSAALVVTWLVHDYDVTSLDAGAIVGYGLFAAVPWMFGRVIRIRRDRERLLEQRALTLERDVAEAARRAVEDERTRIAREIHDVVGHALGVIVVQAEGGGRLIATHPGETRRALDTIGRTGREALGEMRRLVGLLRVSDEQPDLSPQPGLAQLETLAAQMRTAGLPVEVVVEGEPALLAPSVDLSAYRIAQEALTNVLRHAGPARARVLLRYGPSAVEVSVVDDGAGPDHGDGVGHGLIGMRERVTLFGGDVEAGPQAEGGYAVRARLPYGGRP